MYLLRRAITISIFKVNTANCIHTFGCSRNLCSKSFQKLSSVTHPNARCMSMFKQQVNRNHGNRSVLSDGWQIQKLSNTSGTPIFPGNMNKNYKERLHMKKIKSHIKSPEGYKITAYCTAHSYNIKQMENFFKDLSYNVGLSATPAASEDLIDPGDILRVASVEKYLDENKDIFLFKDGMIVFWNFNNDEQYNVLKDIRRFENKSYDSSFVMEEVENLNYSKQEISVHTIEANRNVIHIPDSSNIDMDKFTISNAMAMSVKLGILEAFMEDYIVRVNEHKDICSKSEVLIKRKEVVVYMGELCNLRHTYNLLEFAYLPDFCWEDVKLEGLYYKVLQYMDVRTRTSLLDERMRSCINLMALLKDLFDAKRMHVLEVTIVVLIFVEIVIAVIPMVTK